MLRERLYAALKDAADHRDERAAATLRLILCALNEREACAREAGAEAPLADREIEEILRDMVEQRRSEIARCEAQARLELAQQEADEIRVIQEFLPPQMSEAEIARAVEEAIAATGAARLKDAGRVIAALKARYDGQMNFASAKRLVRQHLN